MGSGKTAPIIAIDYETVLANGWQKAEIEDAEVYYLIADAVTEATDLEANAFTFSATFNSAVQSKNVDGTGETTNVVDAKGDPASVMEVTFGVSVEFASIQKMDGDEAYSPEEAYEALMNQFKA